jgi:hypothetical protein
MTEWFAGIETKGYCVAARRPLIMGGRLTRIRAEIMSAVVFDHCKMVP